MTGTGRRRKQNPDEEGLPQPPPASQAPHGPAGYGGANQDADFSGQQYGQQYSYDWRQSSAASSSSSGQAPSPGPVFDGYSSSGSVYNPVGYDLQDPYSPAAYGASAPAPAPTHAPPPAPGSGTGSGFNRTRTPEPSAFPEDAGLFDDSDLFGTGTARIPAQTTPPSPQQSQSQYSAATAPAPDASADSDAPVESDPATDTPRPKDGYSAADFAFLDEETGQDVKGWLTFVESRSESRADRIRRFRRRLIGAGVAAAVVGASVGAYLLFSGGVLGNSGPTKSVILLQVSDTTGDAVGDALLVADRSAAPSTAPSGAAKGTSGSAAAVLIPSQMLVNTTGFGSQPFGGQMSQSIPAAGKDTVADVLGVTIDGVWRMDETTFAALIDEIGGVQVTTDTAVPAATASAGPTAPAVAKGSEKLTGAQAISYATYSAPGDSPTAQAQRFGQVVTALLAVLPTEATSITADLGHIGIIDDPSLPESKLSPILASLAYEQQAGAFTVQALPLRSDGSMELDYAAAAPIVTRLLGGALKAGAAAGQLSRVLVEDASGHTGDQSAYVRAAAQAKLSNAGYTYIDGASVARRATSVVEVPTQGQHDSAVQVAATLGLPANDIQVVPGMSTIADVTVLLGADWPALAGVTVPPAGSAKVTATPSASASRRK